MLCANEPTPRIITDAAEAGRFDVSRGMKLFHVEVFLNSAGSAMTSWREDWSQLSGLNRGPTVYKTVALPLS